jgi:hypothetical protein
MMLSSQSDFSAMLRIYLMARKCNAHLDGWMISDFCKTRLCLARQICVYSITFHAKIFSLLKFSMTLRNLLGHLSLTH